MSQAKAIRIFDTTLRDGEQSPGASMNIEEKLRIAHQLEKLNVDIFEAGFPIASEGDFEAVKKIAQVIKGPQIAGLSRASAKDIDRAWEALKYAGDRGRIHTFIATSDIHMKYKLKMSDDEVVAAAVNAVGSIDDQLKLAEWIRSNAVDTILGPLSWNEDGSPRGEFLVGQWQNGKPEIVLPDDAATSDQIVDGWKPGSK